MSDFDSVVADRINDVVEIGPGITAKFIRTSPDGTPVIAEVTFEPGAHWPGEDAHTLSAEILRVESGELWTGVAGADEACPAGTWVCAQKDTVHNPYSLTGCTLSVIYPGLFEKSVPSAMR